ncbi:MAG: alpha-galactosidase [Chloroflexia bacterium]
MAEISWQERARGVVLENAFWRLDYDLLLGLFNLTSPRIPAFQLRWARSSVLYLRGQARGVVGSDDCRQRGWSVQPVEDRQGRGYLLTVTCADGRRPALEFRATLYDSSPLLVLEVALHNTLAEPIAVSVLQPLELDPDWGGRISLGRPLSGFYSAGWQSWSPAVWRPAHARAPHPHLGPLTTPMHGVSSPFPARPGCFQADLVGVLTSAEGPALLAGLLTTADQFGRFQARLSRAQARLTLACSADGMPLSPGERLSSERTALLLADSRERPLEAYAEALGKEMEAIIGEEVPRGWCSWTAFYQDLTEEDVRRQVEWLARHREELPVEVIQVDDGWERAIGDWTANERFPHGMAHLAEEIRQAGFRPGLWLAPFIVHPRSQLAKAHPEWLLRDERGRPVNAGYGWGDFCSGLDLTHPEVQDWLRRLIASVAQEWGYTYLKLDFLYAAALPARRYRPDVTRAQALRRGLEIIREVAGEQAFLLGCGCPLGPAVGLVDGMRIGTDVSPNWRPRQGLITPLVRGDPTFPATASCLRNTLTRSWMHRRLWLNDPDALILRRANNRLTPAEVRSLLTVAALSGGLWMLGDDLPSLEEERRVWAALGLPPHRGGMDIPDLLRREVPEQVVLERSGPWGQGRLVALFNWGERPAEHVLEAPALGLPADRSWHGHEFWSGSCFRLPGHARLVLPPHGCAVFLWRPVEEGPQWLGSTLHLLQGEEVQGWESDATGVELTLDAGRALSGSIVLGLPNPSFRVRSMPEGGVERLEPVAEGVWRLYLQTKGTGPLRLTVR